MKVTNKIKRIKNSDFLYMKRLELKLITKQL